MTPQQKFEIITTSKEKKYAQAQFEFALLCAERTISDKTPIEVVEFFTLVAIMRTSEDYGDIRHLKDCYYRAACSTAYMTANWEAFMAADWAAYLAAYWAADWAAYRAAYWAAEREIQYQIAEYVWKKWKLKEQEK